MTHATASWMSPPLRRGSPTPCSSSSRTGAAVSPSPRRTPRSSVASSSKNGASVVASTSVSATASQGSSTTARSTPSATSSAASMYSRALSTPTFRPSTRRGTAPTCSASSSSGTSTPPPTSSRCRSSSLRFQQHAMPRHALPSPYKTIASRSTIASSTRKTAPTLMASTSV